MVERHSKYPIQIVLMVSTEVGALISELARREDLHKTEVSRSFLHAGIRRAGYGDILTADPRGTDTVDLGPKAQ